MWSKKGKHRKVRQPYLQQHQTDPSIARFDLAYGYRIEV